LEEVIQDSGIQTRGTIFFKTVQILAYAERNRPHQPPNAENRFKSQETRQRKSVNLRHVYYTHMLDYIQQGQVEVFDQDEKQEGTFYLPHHAVFKGKRGDTKWRIVFHASSYDRRVSSLNDPARNINIQCHTEQTFPRVRTYFWRQTPTSEGRSRPQLYIHVQWLTQAIIPFKETGHLVNKCYGNLPIQRSLESVLSSGGVRISEPRELVIRVSG